MTLGSPDLWARLCARLSARIGYDRYNAACALWHPVRLDADEMVLAVSSPAELDRARRLVGPHLTACAREVTNRKTRVILTIDGAARPAPIPAPPEPRDTEDLPPFVVTARNRFAWEAAIHLVEAPCPLYRTLFLWGPSACGKSHLFHEIEKRLRAARAPARVLSLGGPEYARQFLYSLRHGTLDAFRRRCRAVDILLLDGLEALAAKDKTQDEFLFTLSAVTESGGRALLAAQPPPSGLSGLRPGLRSRLRSGLVVAIDPPDADARLAVLHAWAPASVSHEALDVLARSHTGSLRDVITCLRRSPRSAAEAREAVEADRAKAAERPTLEEIIQVTAREFGVPMAQIYARTRLRRIADARIVCFYLARRLLGCAFEAIGEGIGRRGHVAVLQACRKVASGRSPTLLHAAERIETLLTAGATRGR